MQISQAKCYDDESSNCEKNGRLYTWQQASLACAALGNGWRLPSLEDWTGLLSELGDGYGTYGIGSPDVGNPKDSYTKMMASDWQPTLGGFKDGKKPRGLNKEGIYWSVDSANDYDALSFSFSKYGVIKKPMDKKSSLSCRCVKD